jgi:dGTPase
VTPATSKPLYTAEDRLRLLPEARRGPPEPYRDDWRIDYARLVHCPAFRRLQGKTQLFPGESDFFRNRLTHSIEVSQISKSIGIRLNSKYFAGAQGPDHQISTDLVEFAALAHDLGHPPFGHNGEAALDECMRGTGGFEGNAQTLRILARVEKKRTERWPPVEIENGNDLRRGLNLTYRSLASILKYDREILPRPENDHLKKGYYQDEAGLVAKIKRAVTGVESFRNKFKTIECQIMDIADDIAYSTYDFEDAMKAGFASLLDILRLSRQPALLRRIAIKVWKREKQREDTFYETNVPEEIISQIIDVEDEVLAILFNISKSIVPTINQVDERVGSGARGFRELALVAEAYNAAKEIQENGYLRTSLTSQLVGEFVRGVDLVVNEDMAALSEVTVDPGVRRKIEVLKIYTFESHIEASRLKTVEFRGKEMVKAISMSRQKP